MKRAQFLSVTPLAPAGPDLAAALDFYTNSLGFEIVWRDASMAGVRRGQIDFNLIQTNNQNWIDNSSFSIGVDDLDALYQEYRALPANVGPLEIKPWGQREFHMILPSGVCLQFFQRRSEKA